MARQYSQQRDRGIRHSNPKPQPHKKAERIPGERRFRNKDEPDYWHRWFAWNSRRELKTCKRDFSLDLITKAYENMPAGMYRNNLAALERYGSGAGWSKMSHGFVRPEQCRPDSYSKKHVSKRQALGAAPAKKQKFQFKRTIRKDAILELEGNVTGRKSQNEDAKPESNEDLENLSPRIKASRRKDETLLLSNGSEEQQSLSEKDFDWVDVEIEIENASESPISSPCYFKEDEYVVI